MASEIYRLYLRHDAVNDAVATLDLRDDGVLEELVSTYSVINDTGNTLTFWELSFSSSPAFENNDTRNVICGGPVVSSAATPTVHNAIRATPMLEVGQGERLYLHLRNAAVNEAEMVWNIWMSI